MNVFSALDSESKKINSSSSGAKKTARPKETKKTLNERLKDKPHVSPDEIRAKLAKKNEASVKVETPKAETKAVSSMSDDFEEVQRRGEEAKRALAIKKQAETDVQNKAEEGAGVAEVRPSDVGINNPKDPATVGKLKDVLSKGGFKFSDKEREALSKILN